MWQAQITRDGAPITDRTEAEVAAVENQMEVVEDIDAPLGIWGVNLHWADALRLETEGYLSRRSIAGARVDIEMP